MLTGIGYGSAERRIIIVAPTGRDAALVRAVLEDAALSCVECDCHSPVSYTHLDVYKRQVPKKFIYFS